MRRSTENKEGKWVGYRDRDKSHDSYLGVTTTKVGTGTGTNPESRSRAPRVPHDTHDCLNMG